MLREMGKVKLRKKELAAFIGVEKELQGARAKRDDKRKALNGCESVLGELVGALRKLELSVKLGCKPADLVCDTFARRISSKAEGSWAWIREEKKCRSNKCHTNQTSTRMIHQKDKGIIIETVRIFSDYKHSFILA